MLAATSALLFVVVAGVARIHVGVDAAVADVRTALTCAVARTGTGGGIALHAEDLNDYGCFCGAAMVNVAMTGEPVDAIDACCKRHHTCWKAVDASTEKSGGDSSVRQCAVAPHFISCDGTGGLRCDDYDHNPIQMLRGSIGDACCECERELGKCIAAALDADAPYSVKYKDWSDPDFVAFPKRADGAATKAGALVCGPKTPSLFRRMHGFVSGAGVLLANATSIANAVESVTKDFMLTAEDKTVAVIQVRHA